jgi:hypothetical protein
VQTAQTIVNDGSEWWQRLKSIGEENVDHKAKKAKIDGMITMEQFASVAQFLICKNEVYREMSSRSRSTKIDHDQLE